MISINFLRIVEKKTPELGEQAGLDMRLFEAKLSSPAALSLQLLPNLSTKIQCCFPLARWLCTGEMQCWEQHSGSTCWGWMLVPHLWILVLTVPESFVCRPVLWKENVFS